MLDHRIGGLLDESAPASVPAREEVTAVPGHAEGVIRAVVIRRRAKLQTESAIEFAPAKTRGKFHAEVPSEVAGLRQIELARTWRRNVFDDEAHIRIGRLAGAAQALLPVPAGTEVVFKEHPTRCSG